MKDALRKLVQAMRKKYPNNNPTKRFILIRIYDDGSNEIVQEDFFAGEQAFVTLEHHSTFGELMKSLEIEE